MWVGGQVRELDFRRGWNDAGFPEIAEHVAADEFDLWFVVNGGIGDEFGDLIFFDAYGNSGNVAVVDVAGQENLGVFLADFVFIELEADVLLVGFADSLDGGVEFEHFIGWEVGVLN